MDNQSFSSKQKQLQNLRHISHRLFKLCDGNNISLSKSSASTWSNWTPNVHNIPNTKEHIPSSTFRPGWVILWWTVFHSSRSSLITSFHSLLYNIPQLVQILSYYWPLRTQHSNATYLQITVPFTWLACHVYIFKFYPSWHSSQFVL
jgi:hypothetical protein